MCKKPIWLICNLGCNYFVVIRHFYLIFICSVLKDEMDKDIPQNFGRRFGEIDDLPDSLKAQLQAIKIGDVEQVIIDMLRDDFEGIANLDEILVGLYRRKREVFERQFISNKLYRMNKAGLIASVPKKKGVYRSAS